MSRFPLGQPVRLSTTVRDASGTLTNPTAITLVVTKPDGTLLTYPSPTNDGVGLYHQDVPASSLNLAGHYLQTWTSTGVAAGVSHGSFDVYDPADLSIISLEDAKQHLNIPAANTTEDEELRYFLSATTTVVTNLAGAVVPRTVTEVACQRGTAYSLQLAMTPVLSLTSLTSINGGLAYDVASLYVANDVAGIIRRRDAGIITGGPWTAIYRAGRAEVPPNIGLAARILVQHLWETQRGGPMNAPRLTVESADVIPGIWFAIPNKVKELLEGETIPLMAY